MDSFLVIILVTNFFVQASGSILGPFFPDMANSKNLETTLVGVIIATYFVAMSLGSVFIGKYMAFIGKKRAMMMGIAVNSLCMAGFAVSNHIYSRLGFFFLCACIRLFQGISSSFYSTVTYSYMPMLYPDSAQQKIGYLEAVAGLGYVVGPPMGSLALYVSGENYDGPFIFTSVILFLCFFFLFFMMPDVYEKVGKPENEGQVHEISFFSFLFTGKIFITFVVVSLASLCLNYLQPVFSTHLHDLGFNAEYVGVIYALPALIYILSLIAIGGLANKICRKTFLCAGGFILFLAFILAGPDPLLADISTYPFVFVGLVFIGIGASSVMIPGIPEFILIGNKKFPGKEDAVIDISSGLFNVSFAFGGFQGPIFGSFFTQEFGFGRGAALFSLVILLVIVIYIIFGEGYQGLTTPFVFQKKELLLNKVNEQNDKDDAKTEASSDIIQI